MSLLENPPDVLYTRTRREICGECAVNDALFVFERFSVPRDMELLAVLSLTAAARANHTPSDRLVTPNNVTDLVRNRYVLAGTRANPASWLTDRGHVAISMVEIAKDGDDIEASLREPFLRHTILDELYNYTKNAPVKDGIPILSGDASGADY